MQIAHALFPLLKFYDMAMSLYRITDHSCTHVSGCTHANSPGTHKSPFPLADQLQALTSLPMCTHTTTAVIIQTKTGLYYKTRCSLARDHLLSKVVCGFRNLKSYRDISDMHITACTWIPYDFETKMLKSWAIPAIAST